MKLGSYGCEGHGPESKRAVHISILILTWLVHSSQLSLSPAAFSSFWGSTDSASLRVCRKHLLPSHWRLGCEFAPWLPLDFPGHHLFYSPIACLLISAFSHQGDFPQLRELCCWLGRSSSCLPGSSQTQAVPAWTRWWGCPFPCYCTSLCTLPSTPNNR